MATMKRCQNCGEQLHITRQADDHCTECSFIVKLKAEREEARTALIDTYADLQQMVPGFAKPYVERLIASWQG